jgi:hypothetical protein
LGVELTTHNYLVLLVKKKDLLTAYT